MHSLMTVVPGRGLPIYMNGPCGRDCVSPCSCFHPPVSTLPPPPPHLLILRACVRAHLLLPQGHVFSPVFWCVNGRPIHMEWLVRASVDQVGFSPQSPINPPTHSGESIASEVSLVRVRPTTPYCWV